MGAPGVASRGQSDSLDAGPRGDGGDFDDFADIGDRSLERSENPSPEREERLREDTQGSDHELGARDEVPFGSRRESVSDLPRAASERTGVTYAGEATVENPGKMPRVGGPRAWLRLNEEGQCVPVQIDKHRLAQHLGVPMRDFRMLEPNRSDSYSAAILCRERCIVMHIEQVRLLITSDSVFMQDGRSYTVTRILPELQRRLMMRKLKLMDGHGVPDAPLANEHIPGLEDGDVEQKARGDGAFAERARFKQKLSKLGPRSFPADKTEPSFVTASDLYDDAAAAAKKTNALGFKKNAARPPRTPDAARGGGDDDDDYSQSGRRRSRDLIRSSSEARENEEALPFELVGLEVALEIVCNQLERDRRDVGQEVRASLAGLRKKVDTFNLERVRRVKSKVTRLTGRVAKVRDEIKRYLDDDSDMRDMYLTRKALVEGFHANEHGNANAGVAGNAGEFPGPFRGRQSVSFHSGLVHGSGGSFKMRRQSLNLGGVQNDRSEGDKSDGAGQQGGAYRADPDAERNDPSTPSNPGVEDVFGEELFPHQEDSDLQVVEDLLETYFAHIDSTYAELDAIDQFINDTEDFVNIQLDVTRNQLQKFEVTLTSATLFVSMYSMVGGIYGMNLRNGAESSHATFVLVNALCGTGAVVGFTVIMLYIRSKRWM